jgi:hypothetical protein
MTYPGTLSHPAPSRSSVGAIAPVLIQVPALSARGLRPVRTVRPLRRRRRLRREVRIAGSALLLALPLAATALMLWGNRSSAITPGDRPQGRDPSWSETPPFVSISLSIEPEASAPAREMLPPVQLPDYVLPDDGSEEATHAGS